MKSHRVAVSCLAALLSVHASAPAPVSQAVQREPLTVMTFNIRYGTAQDGGDAWTSRRGLLFEVLRAAGADVAGLQEALDFQADAILAAVPVYAVVGVGRNDGAAGGEMAAILFRKDRLRVAEAGTFWFSDAPATPGSKSWGAGLPRICTWARFVDRDGRGFYVFNVHLDHQSQTSRERSVALLLERINARAVRSDPVIVTGDFNAGEDNPALATLTKPAGAAPFVDTFRALHPDATDVGTFSGFKFGAVGGEKIDFILVQPGTEVLAAEINRFSRNKRHPSDHFPVTARIRLPAQ